MKPWVLGIFVFLIVLWQFALQEPPVTETIELRVVTNNVDKNVTPVVKKEAVKVSYQEVDEEVAAYVRNCKEKGSTTLATSLTESKMVIPVKSSTGIVTTGYILSFDSSGRPTCRPGDLFEVAVNSTKNKLPVKITSHTDPGIYTFTFKAVLAGDFDVCLYLFYSGHLNFATWPTAAQWDKDYSYQSSRERRDSEVNRLRKQPLNEWCAAPDSEFKKKCKTLVVTGDSMLPKKVCGQQWDGGLYGSWVKTSTNQCIAGVCSGDLRFLSTNGWVYVPETCYLRIYNQQDAWSCLNDKKLLFFGDSTLKQPTTNLVEQLLGVPTLKKSFNWIKDNCPSGSYVTTKKYAKKYNSYVARGCANQFEHRQWKIKRANPRNNSQTISLQMVWGGGPSVSDPPWVFPKALDLLNKSNYRDQNKRTTSDVFTDALGQNPDYVFMHAFVWDEKAKNDFKEFRAAVSDSLKRVSGVQNKIHWDTGHPQCLDDRISDQKAVCQSALQNKFEGLVSAHNSHLLMKSLESFSLPDLTATDRYTLASPLSIGPYYCHFGIHFGAHRSFCHMWQPPNPEQCYRDWMADKFELMIWMNKMCSAPPTIGDPASDVTIETGVYPEPSEPPELGQAF